jgi:ankyrin repeat protein
MIKNKKHFVIILIGIVAIPLVLLVFLSFSYPAELDGFFSAIRAVGADVDEKDVSGMSLLHKAVSGNRKLMAKVLIAKGADINAKDKHGRTPLHLSASRGHKGMVELLLRKGANVNEKCDWPQGTPLFFWPSTTPLHVALRYEHSDIMKVLVANGADVNAQTKNGYTPLLFVFWHPNEDIAELLVKKGADVNVKTLAAPEHPRPSWGPFLYGCTPLDYAIIYRFKNLAKLLIAEGADVNAVGFCGKTPLQLAQNRNYTEIVELLLEHGAKE